MAKAFDKYRKLANDWKRGKNLRLTVAEFRGLKKILSNKQADVAQVDFDTLYNDVNDVTQYRKIKIDAEHAAKGIAWLRKLKPRAMEYCYRAEDLRECIRAFGFFTFAGFQDFSTAHAQMYYPDRRTLAPVWRIWTNARKDSSLRSVDYVYASWQSGIHLDIFNVMRRNDSRGT